MFSCLLLSIYSVSLSSQRHGYCTLGEAFNRLDFSSAIQDIRRFNYVVKVSSLFYICLLQMCFLMYPYVQKMLH